MEKRWTNGHQCAKKKKMYLDTNLIPFTKFNSELITDVNVKCLTIKFLDDIGENLEDLGFITFLIQHQRHNPWR